jgi:hypothetical protein
MATRFRLPATGTAAVSPALQTYTHTGTTRRPLPTTDATALATTAVTPDAADHLVAGDTFHRQFVSDGVVAQTIPSGITVKCAVQCLEAHTNNNLVLQLWVGLYDAAGTTLLATLLAKTADTLELATTIQNRFLSATTTAGYTCTGGERLVVEFSVTGTPGPAAGGVQGHNASLRWGAAGAGGDLPENDTEAGTTFNPWFEIAADLFTVSVTAEVMSATAEAPAAAMAGAGALTLTDSLTGYWKLEEASGTRADSHGAYPLDVVSGANPGNAAGKIGNAASYVANGWVGRNDAGLLIGTGESWSFSCWINPTGYGNYRTIMNAGADGNRPQYLFLTQTAGALARWSDYNTGVAIATGVWTHIVYTFTTSGVSTGTEQFYVNGVATSSRTGAIPANGAGPFYIGVTVGGPYGFDGLIDEVGFWRNRALTLTEVGQLYNGGAGLAYPLVPPAATTFAAGVMTASADAPAAALTAAAGFPPDAVAYWTLDEASGTRADTVGTNHLTDNNTVGSAVGKIGTAGSFVRASSEYLSRADNAALSLGASDLTISAWVYLNSKPGGPNCIVSKYQSGTNEYLLYYDGSADRFRLLVYTSGSLVWVTANVPGSPALSTWHHVVGTFTLSGATGRLIVNDGTADSASGSGTPNDSTWAFTIGANALGTEAFDGRIDEVGIWKRVLTATEITALYNGGAGLTYPVTPATTFAAAVMAATAASAPVTPQIGALLAAGTGSATAASAPPAVTTGAVLAASPSEATASLQTATLSAGAAPPTVVGAGVMTASATAPIVTVTRGALLDAPLLTASAAAPVATCTTGARFLALAGSATAAAPTATLVGGIAAVLSAGVWTASASAPVAVFIATAAPPRIWAELVTARPRSLLVRAGRPDAEYDR